MCLCDSGVFGTSSLLVSIIVCKFGTSNVERGEAAGIGGGG